MATSNQVIDVVQLTNSDLSEIEQALRSCRGIDFEYIQKSNFRLPNLSTILEAKSKKVHSENSVIVIKGLDPRVYCREDNVILYLGIASYFGDKRGRQSPDGNKLVHVTNLHSTHLSPSRRRPVSSNIAMPFHNDTICSVLALYCLSPAYRGGEMSLASVSDIYHDLSSSRPEVINLLARPDWLHDAFGPDHGPYLHPLLYRDGTKVTMNFSPRTEADFMTGSEQTMSQTMSCAEAMLAVELSARKHSIELNLRSGDMCFVNNLAMLHCRAAFEDGPSINWSQRHVLRLWLSSDQQRHAMSHALQTSWQRRFAPLAQAEDRYELQPFNYRSELTSTYIAFNESDCWSKPSSGSQTNSQTGGSSTSPGGQNQPQASTGSNTSSQSSGTQQSKPPSSQQPTSRLGGTGD